MAGLDLWQNPRLACALTMALMAAGCVALMLLWLLRLKIPAWAALVAATISRVYRTSFSLHHPTLPRPTRTLHLSDRPVRLCPLAGARGSYRSWGRLEPFWLSLLSAALAFLPFLHARFTPIALLAGIGIVLQIRGTPKPKVALAPVVGVVVVALVLLLQFNLAFSGDWLGTFKPANAWEEGALDAATWWTSLPGHWLHGDVGLVNSTPIYLYSLLGLALLAKTTRPATPDRRRCLHRHGRRQRHAPGLEIRILLTGAIPGYLTSLSRIGFSCCDESDRPPSRIGFHRALCAVRKRRQHLDGPGTD